LAAADVEYANVEFSAPVTLAEALAELAGSEDALALGGGTSVGLLLKNELIEPGKIVWLGRIPELRSLGTGTDGELVIGATVTLREIAASEPIRREYPALTYAAGQVGNPRVRAVATLGGALAHSDARQDVPPVLYVLDARVRIAGQSGRRDVPVSGFHTGFMETVLAPGELITDVVIPPAAGRTAAYARFTPGSAEDYPTVSAAAAVTRDGDGRVTRAVLAVGGAGPVPLLVSGVTQLLGPAPGEAEIGEAARAAGAAARPLDDQRGSARYKKAMAAEWSARVLRACLLPDRPPVPGLVAG
jgi:carbon-monoxide dehydrogenase medium subunit